MSGSTNDEALFRDSWKMFDSEGKDELSVHDFKQLLKSLGMSPSAKEFDRILKVVDADGTGKVKFNSWLAFMKGEMVSPTAKEIVNAFTVFDKNNNGYIAPAELRHLLAQLDEKLTDQEFNEMLRVAGIDVDGEINFEEFAKILTQE